MRKERIVKLVILLLLIFSGSIYSKKLTPSVSITSVNGILAFGNLIKFKAIGYDNDSQNGGQAPRIEWDFSYEEASGFRVDAVTNNESASTVTHIYDRKGTYTVIARYYDNDGAHKDSYRQITISGLKRYYYVKDHLGNIRQTLDTELNVVSAQDYAPYGALLREYNESSPNEKYKFTEKERDKESNFDYFGARYYDSDIGRWLSVDPLADKYPGYSPYNYTLNNPLKFIDPDGRNPYSYITKAAITLGIMDAEQKSFRMLTDKYQATGVLPKGSDGPADAWRHAATSKYFAEKYGKTATNVLGFINELRTFDDLMGADADQYNYIKKTIKMDLTNNKIGRDAAGKNVDLLEKANEGELKTLEKNNNDDKAKDYVYPNPNKEKEDEDEKNN